LCFEVVAFVNFFAAALRRALLPLLPRCLPRTLGALRAKRVVVTP
jgi:hypothetical protein